MRLATARRQARKAIESLYDSRATVIEYQSVFDEVTKRTKSQEVTVLTDLPCRVSFKNIAPTGESDTVHSVSQSITLFISPNNITIKPGSKISVTRKGITTDYKNSGQPAVYDTHQEIGLRLFKENA